MIVMQFVYVHVFIGRGLLVDTIYRVSFRLSCNSCNPLPDTHGHTTINKGGGGGGGTPTLWGWMGCIRETQNCGGTHFN